MKWQPIPARAFEPSGTLVDVLCGQPEQKVGHARCARDANLSSTLLRQDLGTPTEAIATEFLVETARDYGCELQGR